MWDDFIITIWYLWSVNEVVAWNKIHNIANLFLIIVFNLILPLLAFVGFASLSLANGLYRLADCCGFVRLKWLIINNWPPISRRKLTTHKS